MLPHVSTQGPLPVAGFAARDGSPVAIKGTMQCPECQAINEAGSAACERCGLILLSVEPKRRAEDLAVKRRRSSDLENAECPYCRGQIDPKAVRCRHCSEVVDEEFYRERAQRLRSKINYASWVGYLFGLAALLVFRPVGVLSIAAGLLLSIAYYAIPVDPPASKNRKKTALGTVIRNQFKLERVGIPLPALRNKRLIFVGTPLVAALIGYSANLFLLQQPVNDILKENAAFQGMKVSAHYRYWVVPGVIVYDLKSLSFRQTPIDVHTAFLEFADKMKEKRYSRVDLSFRGQTRFSLDGASFAKLGEEYSNRNFDYVLYTLPRLFSAADGEPLNTDGSGRDALLEFHRRWYGADLLTRTVKNGL
ncbi:MAG TPA: zinc ribbon domain-containing protein [Thermoanaerobaculia bacterium]